MSVCDWMWVRVCRCVSGCGYVSTCVRGYEYVSVWLGIGRCGYVGMGVEA